MKILVFLDHDIVAKNFILNNSLDTLNKKHTLLFVLPLKGSTRRITLDYDLIKPAFSYVFISVNSRRVQIWRWLLFSRQLRFTTGNHEKAIRRLRRLTLGPKASFLLTICAYQPFHILFLFFCNFLLFKHSSRDLDQLLEQERPDIIFHPTVLEGLFVNDLILSASKKSIPTVFAMNSWDNPSTKRAVVGKPNHLLVWGSQTQEHSIRFLNMPPSSVHCFGSAHLDLYVSSPVPEAPLWLKPYLTEGNTIVLYAGSNTSSNEFQVLQQLDHILSLNLHTSATIIYRPHPWGQGGHNGHLILDHVFKHILIDPSMLPYLKALKQDRTPIFLTNPEHTHALLAHCDLVISPLSTILFEAALLKKSVAVHLPSTPDSSPLLSNGLPMLHFEEFLQHPSVASVTSAQSIFSHITNLLSNPTKYYSSSEALRSFCTNRILSTFDLPWSERIVDFLESIHSPSA
jgi:hypothetical protein